MTIRAKVVSDHKKKVSDSKDAAKTEAETVVRRAEAVTAVKSLTENGTVSFAALDDTSKVELIDALVVLSGVLS